MIVRVLLWSFVFVLFGSTLAVPAQEGGTPNAVAVRLVPAEPVLLPGGVDSNSPAFWENIQGRSRLRVMTSWWTPSISQGPGFRWLSQPLPVKFVNGAPDGKWMEAVLQDDAGSLYGFYHYEPQGLCGEEPKTAPQIGAARSRNNGASWEDLGVILQVSRTVLQCATPNAYFAGGVGDFTVVLDQRQNAAYFFFSTYSGDASMQGIAAARLSWAQRDNPQGHLQVWDGQTWSYPRWNPLLFRPTTLLRPIYAADISWHDPSGQVDSFWGPSVHWNFHLNQYVMLLNRASDYAWSQEGVYIAFSPSLEDPGQWTAPVKIIEGGEHYPQVLGLERGFGTDKVAGAWARLFLRGRSDYFIVFQ